MKMLAILVAAVFGVVPSVARAHVPSHAAAIRLPDIAANDNTVAGGRLDRGVLHLDLVARRGIWHPDGAGTAGLAVESFGEAGKALQIPGPYLHVPLGSRVVATVHNALSRPLTVRGLARPSGARTDELHIASGATARVSFVADRAGAFGYYGSDRGETLEGLRVFDDAELSGAIVVEKPHAAPVDHAFVLTMYAPVRTKRGEPNFIYMLETINGRSFPATEQLSYPQGRHVRWAVYNASAMNHPMHLHGFYYRLERPDAFDEVTHAFHPGEAEELVWTADRAGDWMFHCHISDHISRHPPIADMHGSKNISPAAIEQRFHLPDRPMGGMVIALHVTPKSNAHPIALAPKHRLALAVDSQPMPQAPYQGFNKQIVRLTDGASTEQTHGNLAPTLVLTRGEPVAIAITNHMNEGTSIHWHGIALANSYYDGGAGMGMPMAPGQSSPPIAPGGTFVAHFTPPDAGTFMYHAHMDDGWQQAGGLEGPLVVLPPGRRFDPATDHIVMISDTFERAGSPFVAIDGTSKPDPLTMTAGVPQRVRFAELSLGGENLVVSLCDGVHVVRWTPIAKDGRDLPHRLQRERVATVGLTIGETRDFRFTPAAQGTLRLNIYDLDNNGMLVGSQPIDVVPQRVSTR